MKNGKLFYWTFGLSTTAILLSLTTMILWLCNSYERVTIIPETYISIIVTLLAVIVTIIMGWQIYSVIDVKEKLPLIDKLKEDIETQSENLRIAYIESYHFHGIAIGDHAKDGGDFVEAFHWYIVSLSYSLQLQKVINVELLLENLEYCRSKMRKGLTIESLYYKEITDADKKIRESASYDAISKRYEFIYNAFVQNIRVK